MKHKLRKYFNLTSKGFQNLRKVHSGASRGNSKADVLLLSISTFPGKIPALKGKSTF